MVDKDKEKLAAEVLKFWVKEIGAVDVASALRVKSQNTVTRWIKRGWVPSFRVKKIMETRKGEQR